MLFAQGIHKKYGQLEILKGVDLRINSGEIVSIVGSFGAGKTTLLQILGTLDRPDSGTLEIAGVNPFKLSSKDLSNFRNQSLGFIFQFHQLLPEFSAIENAMLPALIGGKSKKEAEELARPLLVKLGIEDRSQHKPSELSGGEQQRVAIAKAIAHRPRLLLADEPSGNLDEETGEKVMDLLFKMVRETKTTLILVTHDPDLAKRCSRVVNLEYGSLA